MSTSEPSQHDAPSPDPAPLEPVRRGRSGEGAASAMQHLMAQHQQQREPGCPDGRAARQGE